MAVGEGNEAAVRVLLEAGANTEVGHHVQASIVIVRGRGEVKGRGTLE